MKNKKIVLFSVILVIIVSVIGVFGTVKLIKYNSQKENEQKIPQPEFPYGYDKLNEWQQELYDKLAAWQQNTLNDPNYWTFEYYDDIELGAIREVEDISLVIDLFNFNHPNTRYFTAIYPDEMTTPCLDGPGQMPIGKAEKVIVKTRLDTLKEKEWFEIADKKAEEIVNEIINKNDTDIVKIAKIFIYLDRNTKYDREAYELSKKDGLLTDEEFEIKGLAASAYGALINKKAVCTGLSLAYHLLAEKAGIYVLYASSVKEHHAWNIVWIDGEFYFIDVTSGAFLYDSLLQPDSIGAIELPSNLKLHKCHHETGCTELGIFQYMKEY